MYIVKADEQLIIVGGDDMRSKLIKYRGERTQQEMAEKFGVTQQCWARWEKGLSSPRIKTMKEIEVDSGIPMEELFADVFNNLKLSKTIKSA